MMHARLDLLSFGRWSLSANALAMDKDDPLYRGPIKRSVTIAGHQTSISLEPTYWEALGSAARAAGLPVNALVARIDAERIAVANPPNLASAVRLWLFAHRAPIETHSH